MAKIWTILVIVGLVAAVIFLGMFYNDLGSLPAGSGGIGMPGPGESIDPQFPGEMVITADDLRELALALAAVITAISGLLGLMATQVWRGREETRINQTHQLALERERLELERERLQLEKERLQLEREKESLREKGATAGGKKAV